MFVHLQHIINMHTQILEMFDNIKRFTLYLQTCFWSKVIKVDIYGQLLRPPS